MIPNNSTSASEFSPTSFYHASRSLTMQVPSSPLCTCRFYPYHEPTAICVEGGSIEYLAKLAPLRRGSTTAATTESTTAVEGGKKSIVSNCHFINRSNLPEETVPRRNHFPGQWRGHSQLRVEFTRSTALLALTSITSSVATLTALTVTTATAEGSALALTLAQHASGRNVALLLLDVGSRHDLGGQVKPLSEVVETLGGQGVVVPLPRELSLDVAAAGQGLQSLDDIQVLNIELGVLREVVVLGGDEDALAEQSLVNGLPVGLGDEHLGGSASMVFWC